ncbi:unnamed protein product [Phytomonas sp. EM1]|nr:unnamed protein product [Phytomonas sp. EM1]|eukprot:CCW65116.1 unnamed protein product [Phytomonas sp. isolate EM1]
MPLKKTFQSSNVTPAGGGLAYSCKRQPQNTTIKPRLLPAQVQQELMTILSEREELEQELAQVDETIYDLESVFLKQCVAFGGSLFDGYGPERESLLHKGINIVFPSTTDSSDPTAPSLSSPMAPSLSVPHEDSGYAFRSRLHSFTPIERIFSTSSVGTLGRVERIKSLRTVRGDLESTKMHRRRRKCVDNRYESQSESSIDCNIGETNSDSYQNMPHDKKS